MPRPFLRPRLRGLAIAAATTAAAATAALAPAALAFDASRVNAFCLAGFNTAMAASGKTAPAGMADFTCTCFSNRLQQGQSIDQARVACRAEAAKRFTVQ